MKELLQKAIEASLKAGEEILKVYESDFAIEHKDDKSPLTLADKKAHLEIVHYLKQTELPILSEEGRKIPYEERKYWEYFWMVDPLDGTKEFIKRNGEFTVNIALIHQQHPILGVIYVPVKDILYFSSSELGAYRIQYCKSLNVNGNLDEFLVNAQKLPVDDKRNTFAIVGSRSHMSKETEEFIEQLKNEHGEIDIVSMGSSLKLCLVAEGKANIYPRFAPTMEWDTAAGHAIANGAGKRVISHLTGKEMLYNKDNLLNDWFVVK